PHRRAGGCRAGHPLAASPLHALPAVRRAAAPARRAPGAHRPARGRSEPRGPAIGLPLPPALPPSAEGRRLRGDHAAARGEGARPVRGLHQGAGPQARPLTRLAYQSYVAPRFFPETPSSTSGWRAADGPASNPLEVTLGSIGTFGLALLQIPGMEAPELTWQEKVVQFWVDGGELMWPLGACALIGLVVIVWKLIDL